MENVLASQLGRGNGDIDAAALLRRFGNLRSLIAFARRNSGKPSTSDGAMIELVAASCALVEEALTEEIESRSVFPADESFQRLLRLKIGMQPNEQCLAAYVGSGSRMICLETVALGSRTNIGVPCGSIVRRAVELDALGVILAHNHPSGIARPSECDVAVTAEVRRRLSDADIVLIDHLLVTTDKVFSIFQNCEF